MLAFDDPIFRTLDQGCGERLLGRWNYFTITGKKKLKTTIDT